MNAGKMSMTLFYTDRRSMKIQRERWRTIPKMTSTPSLRLDVQTPCMHQTETETQTVWVRCIPSSNHYFLFSDQVRAGENSSRIEELRKFTLQFLIQSSDTCICDSTQYLCRPNQDTRALSELRCNPLCICVAFLLFELTQCAFKSDLSDGSHKIIQCPFVWVRTGRVIALTSHFSGCHYWIINY